jgi:hypothetical protein
MNQEWMAKWERERAEAKAKRKLDRKGLRDQLVALGVSSVRWDYDGSGDDGCVSLTDCIINGQSAPVPPMLVRECEEIGYGTLEDHHGGWENNEGAFGELEWDLATDKITIDHNHRIESSEQTITEDA